MTADLSLPPLYTPVIADAGEDARECARRLAGEGAEAGVFVFADGAGRLDCAVVLRPEESLEEARRAVLVGALALCDAVGMAVPAGTDADLVWPAGLRINGGSAGGLSLDVGPVSDGVPAWLVLGAVVSLAPETDEEGGERPDVTCLWQEGCADVTARDLAEGFARYLLNWIDRWQDDGFEVIARHWTQRATMHAKDTTVRCRGEAVTGRIEGLDGAGGLILETGAGRLVLPLAAGLSSVDANPA